MAKTKTLISFAVTAKLICVFVFAYAKSRYSHDEAQMLSYTPDISMRCNIVVVFKIYILDNFEICSFPGIIHISDLISIA